MKKLRWGVLGCAKIAREHLIPAIQSSETSEVVAVASRSADKAKACAEQFNIPQYFDSYEALLQSPDVDVVYNPMPNHLHVPWSVKALEAGKHVLCEKPLGMSAQDLKPLKNASNAQSALKVMEAFMYRFHPQWDKAKEIVSSGALGEVKMIDAAFTYNSFDPNNVRYQKEIGGGALMDVGCYCISASRYLFGKEPTRVMGVLDIEPLSQVDRHVSGMLDFGTGCARFTSSMQVEGSQSITVLGTNGRMVIESPFFLPASKISKIVVTQNGQEQQYLFENINHYRCQIDALSKSIINSAPVPTPLIDAENNMKVIDALFTSSQTQGWVGVEDTF